MERVFTTATSMSVHAGMAVDGLHVIGGAESDGLARLPHEVDEVGFQSAAA